MTQTSRTFRRGNHKFFHPPTFLYVRTQEIVIFRKIRGDRWQKEYTIAKQQLVLPLFIWDNLG